MNVLIPPQPPLFPHQHETSRLSPPRSMSPFHNNMSNRKRKVDDDGDEMSVSPQNSPAVAARQLARPSKRVRSHETVVGRPLSLSRLLETLDANELRTVLGRICEAHPQIGQEVVSSAPRPTVAAAYTVLAEYQAKLKAALPYGESSAEYTYYRVKPHLIALLEALSDFTPQYLPPNESQTTVSLQYLDGATKVIHSLPDWEPQAYRHHKENAYDEIAKAWELVINEAAKRGGGFNLHSGGWEQTLAKHNEVSGGRLSPAVNAMATGVGWMGHNPNSSNASANPSEQNSILNQLMSGAYGPPVRVGPW